MNLLMFFYYGSIFIQLAAFVVCAFFVVPLQIKEARVKNGLAKLRKQLLLVGISIALLSLITAIVLSLRFFISGDIARYISIGIVFFHSIGFLIVSATGYKIYHQQYTDEYKLLHKKIDILQKNR